MKPDKGPAIFISGGKNMSKNLEQMEADIAEFIKTLCKPENKYIAANMPIYEI